MSDQASNSGKGEDRRAVYYREQVRSYGRRYREFHAPSVEVVLNLIYTYDLLASHLARNVGQQNLSLSAFNVLAILSRSAEKSLPLSELSELLLVTRANITGLIDCLEQRGLVARTAGEADRRVRLARITPAGEELLQSMLPQHYREIRSLCAKLSDGEKESLNQLLDKLRLGLQRGAEKPTSERKRGKGNE